MPNIDDYIKSSKSAQQAYDSYKLAKGSEPTASEAAQITGSSKFGNTTTSTKSSSSALFSSSNTASSDGGKTLIEGITKTGGLIESAVSFVNTFVTKASGLAQDLLATQMGSGKGADYTKKILGIIQKNGIDAIGGLKDFIEVAYDEVLNQLKQESELLTEVNSKIGISGDLSEGIRNDMIEASKEGARYGITLAQIGEFYTTMASSSGKFALINKNIMEAAQPVSAVLGKTMSEMGEIVARYETVGLGADKTIKELDGAAIRTRSLGLNARKVADEMTNSIGKLNEFGFKNGIQGLERMTQKAVEFRMSMSEVFKLADNVFTPEKAVDLSASLQVLGGAMGDFNDPIKLMYMATNNVEGLQDALIGATEGLATYNQEQGRFEITGLNLRKAQEMAKALGVDYKELTNSAIAGAERLSATTALMGKGFNIKDDEKEFLINMSRMEGGEMKIVIPQSLSEKFNEQTEISLDSITEEQKNMLVGYQKEFKNMDTKQIAMSQLTETEKMSRGIDVIATYYKIQGSRFATGLAEGATKDFRKDMGDAINKFSSEKAGTSSKGAYSSGRKVGEFMAHPIDNSVKGVKDVYNKITGNKSTTQPTTQKVEMIHTFNPTNPVEDGLQKAISRDNSLLESWTSKSKNDLTTPQVAHKN